jgi:hypothetical protein
VKEQHASVPLRRSRSFECLVRSFSTNSRPALRAASGRPPARRRHDGHRGTGLTLQPRGSQSRHERPVGAHLGHAPTDSSGQPRSTTDPSACRFTCADAVDQHPARNHTVYGMQEARGSNPLSSTTTQTAGLRSLRYVRMLAARPADTPSCQHRVSTTAMQLAHLGDRRLAVRGLSLRFNPSGMVVPIDRGRRGLRVGWPVRRPSPSSAACSWACW